MAIGTGHRLDDIAHELFQLVTQICLSTLRGRRRGGELKEVEFLTLSLLQSNGTMIVGDIQKLLGILPAQMLRVILRWRIGNARSSSVASIRATSARSTCV